MVDRDGEARDLVGSAGDATTITVSMYNADVFKMVM